MSNGALVLNITKIFKQYNKSISAAEDIFYSDVKELLKRSKITVTILRMIFILIDYLRKTHAIQKSFRLARARTTRRD